MADDEGEKEPDEQTKPDEEEDTDAGDPLAERRRSIERAKTHFTVVITAAIFVAALLIAMGIPDAALFGGDLSDQSTMLQRLSTEVNGWPPGLTSLWTAIFLVAVLGALTKRAHAIAYYGFKVQEYEPLTWRYHLAVGWRASLVAVAFIALGEMATPITIDARPTLVLAFAFGAGYFGEATFQVFEKRFRSLIGNEQSPRRPVRQAVDGIDMPIEELRHLVPEDYKPPSGRGMEDVLAGVEDQGLTSTREIVGAYLTSSGREDLDAALGGKDVEEVVAVARLVSTGVPVEAAFELVDRGVTKPENLPSPDRREVGENGEGEDEVIGDEQIEEVDSQVPANGDGDGIEVVEGVVLPREVLERVHRLA